MKYFAYGSNMSISRLRKRVPSAAVIGTFNLASHDLRFHKVSKDGSGKCDAFQTNNETDYIVGVLFEIDEKEKRALDRAEGLGYGYDEKLVTVENGEGFSHEAVTYYATKTNENLKPYSWYLNHVVVGAMEADISSDYLEKIRGIETINDPDQAREAKERAIHK